MPWPGPHLRGGPPEGLQHIESSQTRRHLFASDARSPRSPRAPLGQLRLQGITRNNIDRLDIDFPIGLLTVVTGISGSGKSSLVSQALVELVAEHLGHDVSSDDDQLEELDQSPMAATTGRITAGMEQIKRLVRVDQKPIGRTPRSNLATYTGLFDYVRKLFAATKAPHVRHYDAGRFSFNVAKGRCGTCDGEGFVFVELLFLPGVYSPCPTCHGAGYNEKTLEIKYQDKNIAEVLGMTVDAAWDFFSEEVPLRHSLRVLREVGLVRVVAASDWVIDIGPGAGDEGGRIVAFGTPAEVSRNRDSRTAPFLARFLA